MSPFALGSNLQSCRPNPSSVWRHHSSDKVCLGYRPLWQWRCGLPGRIGNPDGLRVQLAFGKFGRNTQCACTAKALRCFGAAAGDDFVVFAEQQDLGLLVVVGNAVDGQVILVVSLSNRRFQPL